MRRFIHVCCGSLRASTNISGGRYTHLRTFVGGRCEHLHTSAAGRGDASVYEHQWMYALTSPNSCGSSVRTSIHICCGYERASITISGRRHKQLRLWEAGASIYSHLLRVDASIYGHQWRWVQTSTNVCGRSVRTSTHIGCRYEQAFMNISGRMYKHLRTSVGGRCEHPYTPAAGRCEHL